MESSIKNTYLSPFNIEEPNGFPSISQPTIIGSFSLNSNRLYLDDTTNCKYIYNNYHPDHIHYDLNDGIEHVIRKLDSCQDEKLNHILEFIVRNQNKLRNQHEEGVFMPVDFVCFRGLLRLLMCSPYERREPWIVLATKFKGTIYLCAHETEQATRDRLNRTEDVKRILSYGFKFEQFIMTDDPTKKPSTDMPVNENEEFCCMFSAKLNGQRLLYGAEMDGIESEQPLNLNSTDLNQCDFVELKVKLRAQNHRQNENYFRFKLRNWWCQSFLVNIKKIIVGTRSAGGIVSELSITNTKDIPKQCQRYWSASMCVQFCTDFLHLISKELNGVNNPHDVFRFEFDPRKSDYIHMKTYPGHTEFSFLPDWFIKELQKYSK